MAGNLHGRILQCLQQDLIETEVKDMINYCADATDERISKFVWYAFDVRIPDCTHHTSI